MSTTLTSDRLTQVAPRFWARLAGLFYLINVVTSLVTFSGKAPHSLSVASGVASTASYVAVTVLLYYLFRPVNRSLSLVAALFSLAGCANGVLTPLHLLPFHIPTLVFFGFYCVLIGYLIVRSTFMPRILGILMMLAGLGWLTFISKPLSTNLTPYHYIMGGIGEISLTLWLLVMGVNAERWKQQAGGEDRAAG
jgi:hypothetical protein